MSRNVGLFFPFRFLNTRFFVIFYAVLGSDEQERLMAFLVDTLPCSEYFLSNTSVAAYANYLNPFAVRLKL